MKQTVLFAGNYNPPALHHRIVVEALAEEFDQVIVVPCGPYPHKPLTADTPPLHRAVMADLTFRYLPKTRVELFDLEAATFTSNAELERRFQSEGDLWHAVPAEWIAGGGRAESFIHREWHEGTRLWREGRFVVVHRPDEPPADQDLPPNHRTIAVNYRDRSISIRSRVVNHEPIEGLVVPAVEQYIRRHSLYQNALAARETHQSFASPRLLLHVDERNVEARRLAEQLRPQVAPDPELAVVLGGDGTMLHAIRQYWRLRIPFFGINTGHIGFLLNDSRPVEIRKQQLLLYQLPLLWVELELLDAPSVRGLAFNDAWVERASGQTAWMRISVDGKVRLSKVVADGVLVSTAAGSTSYARAMGAPPLPLNTPVQLLVGSNVLTPASWKCVVLPLSSEMLIETLDASKRPLTAYIDGVPQTGVRAMRVRTSRIAAAELAFLPEHNPAEKLAHLQFPV